jgi:hypothetical protein
MDEQLQQFVGDCLKPFPRDQINQIPRGGIKLDYVGHAEVTRRLIEIDPAYVFEPMLDSEGRPVIYQTDKMLHGVFNLSMNGIVRTEVGSCELRKPEVYKELYGDGLRRCAMRFGVALDLWAKSDLPQYQADNEAEVEREPDVYQVANQVAASHPDKKAEVSTILVEFGWITDGARTVGRDPQACIDKLNLQADRWGRVDQVDYP